MQYLFQSVFLKSLGYAIANSLWQTALVWLCYTIFAQLPGMSSARKYRLAVITQVAGFVWFLFTFRFYYQQYANSWSPAADSTHTGNTPIISAANTTTGIVNWLFKLEMLLPYVSFAYLLLIGFLAIRWALGYQRTQLIRNRGLEKMPVQWRLFVQRTAEQLGIRKKVWIYLSETINSPLTIGFWKPVILVPLASINHLSTAQMEAVLLHELAHIKRADYLVNIILSVIEIALFFNPFTQLIRKSIHKERENSCDDWVLQFQYEAADYAEALLRIACLQQTPVFAMTAAGKKNELLTRVKRMIGEKQERFNYRRQLMALLIMTGILSSVAWLTPVKSSTQIIPAKKTAAVQKPLRKAVAVSEIEEPMSVKVDNPLFNPVFFLSKPLKAEISKNLADAKKEMEQDIEKESAEVPELVNESLAPLISGALDVAAGSLMSKQKVEADTDPFTMMGALALKQVADSLQKKKTFLPKEIMGKQEKEKMHADLKKAQNEMVSALKEMEFNTADKKKLKQDMVLGLQTLDQLKKIGLEKIILQSLDAVKYSFDEPAEKNIPRKTKMPPADTERKQEKDLNKEETNETQFYKRKEQDTDGSEQDLSETTRVRPVKLRLIDLKPVIDSIARSNDPLAMQKIKVLLRKQFEMLRKVRVSYQPALLKSKSDTLSVNQDIIIQLQ